MNENAKAYEYLFNRGATRLCHFTKVKSLAHILMCERGIVATEFVSEDTKQQNDTERMDNAKDYVCCSLQYPNCWYWEKAKKRDADVIFKEWVVLTVDLGILKNKPYKYSQCNAAIKRGTYISGDLSKIETLFSETTVKSIHRTPNMLTCCPTDDQAEILVYENIPISYVNGIIVGNDDSANNIAAILKTVGRQIPVFVSADICNTNWSSMVRRGEKPTEIEYNY